MNRTGSPPAPRIDATGAGSAAIVLGWTLLNLAPAVYLLHWRVANEPGAGPGTGLFVIAVALAASGAILFIGGNAVVLTRRVKAALIAWLLCAAVTAAAVSLSPILLLLLV